MISSGPVQFQNPMMGGLSPGGFGGGGDPMQQMLMQPYCEDLHAAVMNTKGKL